MLAGSVVVGVGGRGGGCIGGGGDYDDGGGEDNVVDGGIGVMVMEAVIAGG